ncbi:MAG TPA: EF-Tu/IF-2/RF-3 family GTPase, partial [Gemmataceae bacterium]|nr:EF-Tu/IF-2/RF-3 family GTPase [Gemmataceae bacterium]
MPTTWARGRRWPTSGKSGKTTRLGKPVTKWPRSRQPCRTPPFSKGQRIALLKHTGQRIDDTISQVYVFDRLGRTEAAEVGAGDICAVVGLEEVDIGDTIADFERP